MWRNRIVGAALAAALSGVTVPGQAQECERFQDPSPASRTSAQITFFNDSQYAVRVMWADFNGRMKSYRLVQPEERADFSTYVGHLWHLEMYTPSGAECFGPITAIDNDPCYVHVLYLGGIGIDAGHCDY